LSQFKERVYIGRRLMINFIPTINGKAKQWMKIVTWALLSMLALAILLLGLMYLLPGYDLYIVNSNSMNPTFSAGDVVVTVPPGSFVGGDIKPDDIAVFQIGSEKVTHRIISIEGDTITTKGDANEDPDARPIAASQVSGIYLFRIPAFGYAINFLKSRNGWFLGIIVPAILLVGWICIDIIKEALRKEDSASACTKSKAIEESTNHRSQKNFYMNNLQNKNYKAGDDSLKRLLQEVIKEYKTDE
jgi:signal peptidase I